MDFSYFPTAKFKRVELRWRSLLDHELAQLSTQSPLTPENLAERLPGIQQFARAYQALYMEYLEVVLPQHKEPVRCGAGCANCCHHFPMSVEPFEAVLLYSHLRGREDFSELLEACLRRTRFFYSLMAKAQEKGGEDPEEEALHQYFSAGHACPFIEQSGDCGVYQVRPLTCRMYFSLTDPSYCVPEHLQTPKNRSFIVYLPDEIEERIAEVSEFYAGLEVPEGMYSGMLALNALEGYWN